MRCDKPGWKKKEIEQAKISRNEIDLINTRTKRAEKRGQERYLNFLRVLSSKPYYRKYDELAANMSRSFK